MNFQATCFTRRLSKFRCIEEAIRKDSVVTAEITGACLGFGDSLGDSECLGCGFGMLCLNLVLQHLLYVACFHDLKFARIFSILRTAIFNIISEYEPLVQNVNPQP